MSRSPFHSSTLSPRPRPVAVILLLAGCGGAGEPLEPSPAEPLLGGDTVASYVIEDATGPAPLSTWVRALNAYGAAIPSEPALVTVAGRPAEVRFDGTGYGQLQVDDPGVVAASTETDAATLYALATTWPGFGANPASSAPFTGAELAVEVSTGMVVANGAELWWGAPDGRTHRVLNADGPIVGLRAVYVDVDEVVDVVAWTEHSVFLLRGRSNGGMSWGGGFTAPNYTVGGADVGDLDGDNLPDLAIAWASAIDTSKLDVWNGDGLFSFTAAEPRNLPEVPMDLSIGDNTGEGRMQITVLDVGGAWSRYIAGNELQYMPIGPRTPSEIVIQVDGTLDADLDVNADRADELWIYGPRVPGSARSVYLADLKGQHLEFVPYNPVGAFLARADGDGNEVPELFAAQEDGWLYNLSYDLTSVGSYTPRRLEPVPEHGPIGLHDWFEADGIVDLFVAGEGVWWWWRGENDPEDFETSWWIREPSLEAVAVSGGPSVVADIDGNAAKTEIVAFEIEGGETSLVIHQATPGAPSLERRGSVVVSKNGTAPIDLAVCDTFAWVLLPGELARVNLGNLAGPWVTGSKDTIGSRVDCGAAPNSAVAALLADGTVELLGAGLGVLGTVEAPGAEDVAIGDVGAGPEVRTCAAQDCTIDLWPWGAAGEASFVTASGGTLSWDGGSVTGGGELSFGDVDADGHTDLLAASEGGLVTVLRSAGTAIASPEHYHFRSSLRGAAHAADADGDGHRDLWISTAAGELAHTVAPWVPIVTEGVDDTGVFDTGAPPGSGSP